MSFHGHGRMASLILICISIDTRGNNVHYTAKSRQVKGGCSRICILNTLMVAVHTSLIHLTRTRTPHGRGRGYDRT